MIVTEKDAAAKLRADIREAIRSSKYDTDGAVANEAGISPQYLSDVMRNRRNLTPALVDNLALVLRVSGSRWRLWHRLGAQALGWEI
jgi:transcriptional regulator with XRE-family HTH domain